MTLEPQLLTPEIVADELSKYKPLVIEKSGMDEGRVQQFIDTVPVRSFQRHVDDADTAIGDTAPDDVLYLACALGTGAGIWSDDTDFQRQDSAPVYTTEDVLDTFSTVHLVLSGNDISPSLARCRSPQRCGQTLTALNVSLEI